MGTGALAVNDAAAAATGDSSSLVLPQPYLLFLGDTVEPGFAKTAFGLLLGKAVPLFTYDSPTFTTGFSYEQFFPINV